MLLIQLLESPIPATATAAATSQKKSSDNISETKRAWIHRSAGVKTTGKNILNKKEEEKCQKWYKKKVENGQKWSKMVKMVRMVKMV